VDALSLSDDWGGGREKRGPVVTGAGGEDGAGRENEGLFVAEAGDAGTAGDDAAPGLASKRGRVFGPQPPRICSAEKELRIMARVPEVVISQATSCVPRRFAEQ